MGIAHVLFCVAASCAAADVAPQEPAADSIDFYLSAMTAGRQKLRSGEFAVTGTKSVQSFKKSPLDYAGKLLIFCAFDENRIRIDNLEPSLVADIPLSNPPKMKPGRIKRKFFQTPQKSVAWIQADGSSNIVIGKPDSTLGRFLFFDVRAVGVATWQQMTSSPATKLEAIAADLKSSRREKSVDSTDPKYVQLVFLRTRGVRSDELRYWLSREQDFAPVKLESRTRTLGSPDESWLVDDHAEISWQKIDGVWIPTHFEMTRTDETAEKKLAWRIHWRSVNQGSDDSFFELTDFGAPDTVTVVDTTKRRPAVNRRAAQ